MGRKSGETSLRKKVERDGDFFRDSEGDQNPSGESRGGLSGRRQERGEHKRVKMDIEMMGVKETF